jgi:cytochrome c551/c552
MIKVLASALIGTVIGIAVMVTVIVLAGTHTKNASSVGEGALPITTAATSASSSTSSSSTGSTGSTGSSGGGNAANGKALFTGSAGCSSCHTFTAAGSTGTIGPNLDSLAADAQKAGEPLDAFIHDSIVNPDKYIAPGYTAGIMPTTFGTSLSPTDIADLVAFIAQNQK